MEVSAPMSSGTHTERGAVIRKPGSAWLEGTHAMDLGHMNVVLKWMHLYVSSALEKFSVVHSHLFFKVTRFYRPVKPSLEVDSAMAHPAPCVHH